MTSAIRSDFKADAVFQLRDSEQKYGMCAKDGKIEVVNQADGSVVSQAATHGATYDGQCTVDGKMAFFVLSDGSQISVWRFDPAKQKTKVIFGPVSVVFGPVSKGQLSTDRVVQLAAGRVVHYVQGLNMMDDDSKASGNDYNGRIFIYDLTQHKTETLVGRVEIQGGSGGYSANVFDPETGGGKLGISDRSNRRGTQMYLDWFYRDKGQPKTFKVQLSS